MINGTKGPCNVWAQSHIFTRFQPNANGQIIFSLLVRHGDGTGSNQVGPRGWSILQIWRETQWDPSRWWMVDGWDRVLLLFRQWPQGSQDLLKEKKNQKFRLSPSTRNCKTIKNVSLKIVSRGFIEKRSFSHVFLWENYFPRVKSFFWGHIFH